MTSPAANLTINGARLWDSIMEMAKIGPGIAGGQQPPDRHRCDGEGRALFRRWWRGRGLHHGPRPDGHHVRPARGHGPRRPCRSYVGSHLDTQPTGGKYDGVLGVLGGLEIVRTLNDLNIRTKAPHRGDQLLQRGGHAVRPADAGLGRLCGRPCAGLGLRARRCRGQRPSARSWSGSAGRATKRSARGRMHAFFELHIEQGPILEAQGQGRSASSPTVRA